MPEEQQGSDVQVKVYETPKATYIVVTVGGLGDVPLVLSK